MSSTTDPWSGHGPSPQALRLRRFGMAAATYVLGLGILTACSVLALFPWWALAVVAGLFALACGGFWLAFRRGWNERFADPSLTQAQVVVGASLIPVILLLGRDVGFVAAPYYSVLFVFGMLQMSPLAVRRFALFAMGSYAATVAGRQALYGETLDLRAELVMCVVVLASTAWFAAAATHISQLRARLRESRAHIASLATRDPLTGLWNRRQFDTDIEAAVKQAERHGAALCVAMVDVDHFKAVNDRHGHDGGDAVLRAVAQALQQALRAGDRVARFGGEEFVLLLPATPLAQATGLAERLRGTLAALRPAPVGDEGITASLGLAAWRSGETAAELVRRADQALYRAKAAGRNRVEADGLPRHAVHS